MQDLANLHLLQHLLGYEDLVSETARVVNSRIDIDDELKSILDAKIQILAKQLHKRQEVTFTYFMPDLIKNGGAYVTATGIVKKIDLYNQNIILENKTQIPINDIIDISGDIFKI